MTDDAAIARAATPKWRPQPPLCQYRQGKRRRCQKVASKTVVALGSNQARDYCLLHADMILTEAQATRS